MSSTGAFIAAVVNKYVSCLHPQVLRLLEGLLGVAGRSIIKAEVAMVDRGRSDLVISDLQGSSLLVVEYKQRHSGQASACQQQDMSQVGPE